VPIRLEILDGSRGNRGRGKRRIISTSNTRNKTAKMKNRSEKGFRGMAFGSNPHSKGEAFSRSLFERMANDHAIAATRVVIIKADRRAILAGDILQGEGSITLVIGLSCRNKC